MIGRDEQLQEVLQHCGSVLKSTSQENVLFITGEAGIGKSTFLKAVAEKVAFLPSAPIVSMAECSTPLAGQNIGEAEALKPWVDAADAIVRQNAEALKNSEKEGFDFKEFFWDTAPAWIELIPVVGSAIGAGVEIITTGYDYVKGNPTKREKISGSAMSQQQIFQQYINLLQRISETSPLIIILDDFHWADDSSCNLLFAAARQLQQKPIVFIIAYRPDDALTARDGEGHSILHIKNELERYDFCREIVVPKFSAENLDEFLRKHYPHYHKDDIFEEWLAHEAGGNALFITQFLKTLEEDGFLKKDTGEFTGDYTKVKAPKTAYAVVSERIRRLDTEEREMLQYASVEGETFTATILSKLTEMPQLKALQKLRTVEETHMVIQTLGKQKLYAKEMTAYKFSHALLHRAMYETLGEEERELLHQAILAVLKDEWHEAVTADSGIINIANRIAIHAQIAGDYEFAAEVLLAAAKGTWEEFSEKESLHSITTALDSIEKLQKNSEKTELLKAELLMLRGEIHNHAARLSKAMEDYTAANEIFKKYSKTQREIEAEFDIIYNLRSQSKYEQAIEKAIEIVARTHVENSKKEKATALYLLGRCLIETGLPDKALEKLNDSLSLAREIQDHRTIALALSGLGTAAYNLEKNQEALDYFNEGLEIATTNNDLMLQPIFYGNIGIVYTIFKDYEKALFYNGEALRFNRKYGQRTSEIVSLENIAIVYRDIGNFEKSEALLKEAIELCRQSEDQYGEAYAQFLLAKTYFEGGNIALAKATSLFSKQLSEKISDTFTPLYNEGILKKIEAAESGATS